MLPSNCSDKTLRAMSASRFPAFLLAAVLAVLVWSGIAPHDRFTWLLEVAPTIIGLAILIPTHRSFPLTPLVYTLIALHMAILCVGGKYTCALVPAGDWFRDAFHLSRNHYDRLGHLAQGFVPAMVARELFLRWKVVPSPRWRAFLIARDENDVFPFARPAAGFDVEPRRLGDANDGAGEKTRDDDKLQITKHIRRPVALLSAARATLRRARMSPQP